MNYTRNTLIKDLIEINLPTHADDRGFFREVLRLDKLKEARSGEEFVIKQWNHAHSSKNTLRGVHIAPWNKLIYVTSGVVQSVIVDCRKDSPSYGQYASFELGENTRQALLVPKGCGNSYLVLSEEADYMYLTDQEWAPNKEYGIAWNDPALDIQWKFEGEPTLSDKDKQNPLLSEV